MACSALIIVNDFITNKQSALKTVCSFSVVSNIQPEFNFYCFHICFHLNKRKLHVYQTTVEMYS